MPKCVGYATLSAVKRFISFDVLSMLFQAHTRCMGVTPEQAVDGSDYHHRCYICRSKHRAEGKGKDNTQERGDSVEIVSVVPEQEYPAMDSLFGDHR